MALNAGNIVVRPRRRVHVSAAGAVDDEEGSRPARKNAPRGHLGTAPLPPIDLLLLPTRCGRAASRRVQGAAPVDEAPAVRDTTREEATIAYIEAHAGRKDKVMVSSERPHVRLRADALRCLAVPLSRDGPERQLTGVVLDASVVLLRHRQGGRRRNGRRVLLELVEEQDWLEYVGCLPRTTGCPTRQDAGDMSATAAKYLDHDMVFFPVNHQGHFFVAVLNLAGGEYQVLDSANYGERFGHRFYEQALSKIRDGVGRCMAEAGRADVAGWELRRVPGLPLQTDGSSCGLFAVKCMELWDGEELARSFSMDDVHALRTELAEELVFWELNELQEVKAEIESKRRKMRSSSHVQIKAIDHMQYYASLVGVGVCN